jgi:O-antigen ligase
MKNIQRFALLIFFFSINFEVWDPLGTNGLFSVSKFTGYLYLLTMVPMVIKFSTPNDLKPILRPILLFFGILTAISIINIKSPYYNFFDFSIFQNIILFWILINHEHFDPMLLEKGMLSFALGSVVLALLYNAGIGIELTEEGRVGLFGDNENTIGLRMSISMIILTLTVVQNRFLWGKIRFLLLLPIPVMLQLMAATGSRMAFISFILAFFTGGILIKTKDAWRKILALVIGALAFVIVWKYLMQSEVLKIRILQSTQQGDISERDIIWHHLIPLIKQNPIFGVGKTGYALFSQTAFGTSTSPHNVILEVLCLTGIVGLIIFLLFLYRIFKRSFRIYWQEGLLLPLLFIFSILGMLLSGQILAVKIGWVIYAYIAGNLITSPQ